MSAAIGLTLVASLIASWLDVRARRIPNWLTGTLAGAALIVSGLSGWRSLALSAIVMAVLLVLGTLVYSRGGIGGGDVKFAAAASGMLGWPLCLPFLLYSMIGGGMLSIAFILARGSLRQSTARAAALAAGELAGTATTKSQSLPYAVAFAFGAVTIALSQTVAPFLRILQ